MHAWEKNGSKRGGLFKRTIYTPKLILSNKRIFYPWFQAFIFRPVKGVETTATVVEEHTNLIGKLLIMEFCTEGDVMHPLPLLGRP